ncbi:uncharacterized protein LOC136711100 isoform X2 [Amia ocellicauda]|uniref:uncharacterized protein LOC136711100 isoform X2 n=1 Tax=Amia ocellicauda TaxID=2972642 RepID=UPI003463B93A
MDGLDSRAALLLFLFLVQRESLCEAAERRTVRAGDTVTLDCGVKHSQKTRWFVQRGEEAPVQKIAGSRRAGNHNEAIADETDDQRFSVLWNNSSSSISLKIQSITDTDLALYYCMEIDGTRLVFGNATRLVYGGDQNSSTIHSSSPTASLFNSSSSSSLSPSPSPSSSLSSSPSPPAPCVLSWALLGCVSAGCLLLSGCLCCLWSRRGGIQCVGVQRSPGQSRSEGAAQEADREMNYTTLKKDLCTSELYYVIKSLNPCPGEGCV